MYMGNKSKNLAILNLGTACRVQPRKEETPKAIQYESECVSETVQA
jgi:hypothetical protein